MEERHKECSTLGAEGEEMSEPLAKDRLKEMIRQLKSWGYNVSEIDLEFELAIDTLLLENDKLKSQLAEHEANGLLVYGRKIECLKAELQRTRNLLGSWINKATKAHKELEKLKEERDPSSTVLGRR
jgi:phosphoenolpyruvate carboxylase